MGDDVEIPEDAPRWAWPLFYGGHLRDVRLTAIENECKQIRELVAKGSPITLDSKTIGTIVGVIVAILGGAFGVSHIPVKVEAPAPVVEPAP